jgi:uncharacterized protein DUF4340
MKASPFGKTLVKTSVVLVVLGGLIYYSWRESKKEKGPDKPKEKVLVFDKKRVTELSLAPAAGETVRITRQGEAWNLVAPLSAPADEGEVGTLLTTLEGLEAEEVVAENATDLGQYGLAPAKLKVALQLQGLPEGLALQLGDKAPDGRGVYASVGSKPRVVLLPAYLQSSFEKKPFDLRDRSVLHMKREDVQRLDVLGPEGNYGLARAQGEDWTVTHPLTTLAGRWSVDGLLATLDGLRMESVVEEEAKDLKPYGLDKPARTVVLTLKDGSTRRLEIGKEAADKKYHAREAGSPRVVLVPGAVVDDLAKGLKERRANRLLEVATYEVTGLEVEGEGGKRVYDRSSQKGADGVDAYKWKRSAPDGKDIETSKVQDALFAVGGVEVQEFVDAPGGLDTYGLSQPALKVSLKHEGGRAPIWFELGQKDGAFYARRTDDVAVLKVDAAKAAALLKSFKEL